MSYLYDVHELDFIFGEIRARIEAAFVFTHSSHQEQAGAQRGPEGREAARVPGGDRAAAGAHRAAAGRRPTPQEGAATETAPAAGQLGYVPPLSRSLVSATCA